MKKVLCALIFLAAGSFPAFAADGDDGFYTRADIGYAYGTGDGIKKGYAAQTGFGQKWGGFMRSEFTFEYTRVRLKGPGAFDGTGQTVRSRLPSWAAMTTTYADLFSYKGITPYVGAGIGVSRNDMPDMVVNGRQKFGDTVFRLAWKAVGGIGIDLPENLALDIGYVYADVGRFSTKAVLGPALHQDVKVRKVYVGLRYNF